MKREVEGKVNRNLESLQKNNKTASLELIFVLIIKIIGKKSKIDHINLMVQSSNKCKLEEVIIDMLLLSECDFLVHSLSSVAIAALIFNPSLQHEYLFPSKKLSEKLPHHLRYKEITR